MILDITPEMGVTLPISGKVRNRITTIGVELEGGWNHPKIQIHRDTSVQIKCPTQWTVANQREWDTAYFAGNREVLNRLNKIRSKIENFATGEYPTPPMETFEELSREVKTYYPDHVNDTCGLHVHMSFEKIGYYQSLIDPAYPATLLKYLDQWGHDQNLPGDHPLWARLRGEKVYCKRIFCDSDQIRRRTKDFDRDRRDGRYTVVAYHWSRLRTVECRVLPMFETADQALSAIEQVLKITNLFLVERKLRTEIKGSLSTDGQTSVTYKGAPYDVCHSRVPGLENLAGERGGLFQEEPRRGRNRVAPQRIRVTPEGFDIDG